VVLLPVSNLTVPHLDYNSLIRTYSLKQWLRHWNSETGNKLHAIEPRVNVINLFHLPHWNDIIHKWRIWHTYLMHWHLLRGETSPQCLNCQVELTIEHIFFLYLLQMLVMNFFVLLWPLCQNCFEVASRSIVDFIKETGFYRTIDMHVFTWISIIITQIFTVCILFVFNKYINILNCFYMLNLSVANRFFKQHICFKSFLKCLSVLFQLFVALKA